MKPDRYLSKPVEPTQVEAVLLTEDNLQDAADWWNSFRAHDMSPKRAEASVETVPDTGERALLIPFQGGGWYSYNAGGYLVHYGDGEMRGLTAEKFQQAFDRHAVADPSMCSCLTPTIYGSSEGDGPMVWEPDCKRCELPLTAEGLAGADRWLEAGSVAP